MPPEGENGLFSQDWFAICLSDEVERGQCIGPEFLGGHVVVFRGEDGSAHVVSGYCPHLGTDLALGKVVENALCSAPGSLDTSLSHAAGLIEIAACHA